MQSHIIKLMRKRLYMIVEQGRDNDWVSYIYDFVILAAITASIPDTILRDVLILLSNSYSYSFYTCLLRQDYRICRIYRIF